jgi:ribose-phosphate pyrophosphokinase
MKIFCGSSNKPLAEEIAKKLRIKLSPVEIHSFPDGERRIRVLDKVVGEDCVVVQSCSTPVDTNYMDLFFIVDALKRSGAKSITSVIPYLGYQRQDHIFREGEACSLDVVIETLESVGMNRLIALDLHSIKIPDLFHIPITHVSALPVFAKKIKHEKWDSKDSVLISPDKGGIRRIRLLSDMLDYMFYGSIIKNRDLATGEVTAEGIEGLDNINLRQVKRAFIVDDMISSGGTIVMACNLLRSKGIKEIYVFATHAVFSDESPKILQASLAKKVFVTNSIYIPKEKQFRKLEILSVASLIEQNLHN